MGGGGVNEIKDLTESFGGKRCKFGECWKNVKIIGFLYFVEDFTKEGVIWARNV